LLGDFRQCVGVGFLNRKIQQYLAFFQITPQFFKAVDLIRYYGAFS
jgi:hypothetical protein